MGTMGIGRFFDIFLYLTIPVLPGFQGALRNLTPFLGPVTSWGALRKFQLASPDWLLD